MIKQTLQKVLDKDTSLPEKICILIREQIITTISTLSAFLAGIETIVLYVIGDFGGGRGTSSPSPKDKGTQKKWLHRLANALKSLAGNAAETLPAIVESDVGATLSFLGKTVGFVAEHTWALIVFVVGLIGVWLMQKVKKDFFFFFFMILLRS